MGRLIKNDISVPVARNGMSIVRNTNAKASGFMPVFQMMFSDIYGTVILHIQKSLTRFGLINPILSIQQIRDYGYRLRRRISNYNLLHLRERCERDFYKIRAISCFWSTL